MYKVEIKEDKILNKDVPFKKKQLIYFNNMEEVNKFLNGIKDEYGTINEREDRFTYLDREIDCLVNVSVSSCKNTDIPRLKDNQVWVKLFSSTPCVREAAIFDFYNMDDLEKFIDRRRAQGNFNEFPMRNLDLMYFTNAMGDVVYARKYLWN